MPGCKLQVLGTEEDPTYAWAFLVNQTVKNPPAMQVQSLAWEDPLEKGMATHSSILAWRTPWTEEHGWLQFMGSQRAGHDLATKHAKFSNSTVEELSHREVKGLAYYRS